MCRSNLVAIALCGISLLTGGCRKAPVASGAAAPTEPAPRTVRQRIAASNSPRQAAEPAVEQPVPRAASSARPPETPAELIAALFAARPGAPSSVENAESVNGLFERLRAHGAAAVPAIGEFLKRNEDVSFLPRAGGQPANYDSLRLGLIDLLGKIGGDDAANVAAQVLAGSGEPKEIAALTRTLERIAPQQYREAESTAVREVLEQAMDGGLQREEAIPLFETAQALGGKELIATLQRVVPKSTYPATLALAGMKDGAGIPALIELAESGSVSSLGRGDYAFRPLAQAAFQYPEAASALLDQARQNKIPASAWPGVTAALGGTYIQYGRGLFGPTTTLVDWSSEGIERRLDLIQRIAAATSNTAAQTALLEAKANLVRRLPK